MGRLEEALPLAERAYHGMRESRGEEKIETLIARTSLARLLRERGDLAAALDHMSEVTRLADAALPAGHDFIGRFVLDLGQVLLEMGRLDEAEAALLRAQGLLAKLGEAHPFVQEARESLAALQARRDGGAAATRSGS
jgi:tetratricopeptide (TPR) repeat protein